MKQFYMMMLLLIGATSFSQDARLFENTWFLSRMNIEGVELYPPLNPEVPLVPLDFTIGETSAMTTNVCNAFAGTVDYVLNDTNFAVFDLYATLILCNTPENTEFEGIYANFWGSTYFSYFIVESGEDRTLYVESGNVQAIYSNLLLSKKDFTKENFAIYPNPAETFVYLQLDGRIEAGSEAEVFDALGKTLIKVPVVAAQTKIMTENLPAGIYYVKIKNGNQTVTKKISKS